MTRKNQRLTLALLALGAVAAAALLALSALKDQASFFYSPSDARADGLPVGRPCLRGSRRVLESRDGILQMRYVSPGFLVGCVVVWTCLNMW